MALNSFDISTDQNMPSSLNPNNALFIEEKENRQIAVFKNLLKSMGIESYEENVIPMLIEFANDYHDKVLSEARTYAEVSRSPRISAIHIHEAFTSLSRSHFTSLRSYNDSQPINVKINKDEEGVILPNHVNMLSGMDYNIPHSIPM